MRRSMGEDTFIAFMLLDKQKDVELDIEKRINTFVKKHPRKVLLLRYVNKIYFFLNIVLV